MGDLMKSYRIYWMDTRHRIQRGAWIEATNDHDAKARAADHCDGESDSIEIWDGTRRVDEVECHNAA